MADNSHSPRVFPEWQFEWQMDARLGCFQLVAASVSKRIGLSVAMPAVPELLS